MRLFELIYKATMENDKQALWTIIITFKPLMTKYSKDTFTEYINEDRLSEMQLIMYRRIQYFNIFE